MKKHSWLFLVLKNAWYRCLSRVIKWETKHLWIGPALEYLLYAAGLSGLVFCSRLFWDTQFTLGLYVSMAGVAIAEWITVERLSKDVSLGFFGASYWLRHHEARLRKDQENRESVI